MTYRPEPKDTWAGAAEIGDIRQDAASCIQLIDQIDAMLRA